MSIRYIILAAYAVSLLIAVGAAPVFAAEAPAIEWQTLLGGSGDEFGSSIQQTADGGYILIGNTKSSVSNDVTGINRGGKFSCCPWQQA